MDNLSKSYHLLEKKVLKRKRMIDDRLSVLPDDLILKILSFIGLKDAIGTSVLSSRWRYLWTSIRHLNFSSKDVSTMDRLSNFVTHALCRYNSHHLSSFNLYIREEDGKDVALRIMNHAFSFNVQHLNIKCSFMSYGITYGEPSGFPLSLSGSQTLKHLTLSWLSSLDYMMLTSTREFTSLTTLHLYDIVCPNLENLTLNDCKTTGSKKKVLIICHPRVSNLTLESKRYGDSVNVFTPQLKNLTFINYFGQIRISAPELASLLIRGYCPYMFSTDGFHSLEKAQLSLHSLKDPSRSTVIISMLQEFHNVEFLSLTVDVIQLLNSSVKLISHKPSPLANLKSLKILPKISCGTWWHTYRKVIMSAQVKKYLLSSSPEATLTRVLQKHCCDVAAGADRWNISSCYV